MSIVSFSARRVCFALTTTVALISNVALAQSGEGQKWVPPAAALVVEVRVTELWKQPTVKEFLDRLNRSKVDLNQEFEKNLGVSPMHIEHLHLFQRPAAAEPVLVVTTTAPAKAKVLAAQLPGAVEKQHAGKTYHVAPGGERAVYAVSDQCLVFGPTAEVLYALDQRAARAADAPLHRVFSQAREQIALLGYVDLTAFGDQWKKSLPPQAAVALPLFEAQRTELTFVSGTSSQLDVVMTCANEADAKLKAQTLRAAVDVLRQLIPIGQVELGKQQPMNDDHKWLVGQADTFLRELLEGCKAAQFEATGTAVRGRLPVKVSVGTLATVAAGFFVATEVSAGPPGKKP